MEELQQFKRNTLGKDLALFLVKNNFKLESKLEKHDIYHILTYYPTTVIGKICLSSFNIEKKLYILGVSNTY